jgi:hypothetical protein
MRLKKIKWKIVYGKPKDNSNKPFQLMGDIEGLLEGKVEAFYLTNQTPYTFILNKEIKKNTVYLCRSVAYRYGRSTHILRFKTINEAKNKAQEIAHKILIKKFFVKESRRYTRKVMVEKTN